MVRSEATDPLVVSQGNSEESFRRGSSREICIASVTDISGLPDYYAPQAWVEGPMSVKRQSTITARDLKLGRSGVKEINLEMGSSLVTRRPVRPRELRSMVRYLSSGAIRWSRQ